MGQEVPRATTQDTGLPPSTSCTMGLHRYGPAEITTDLVQRTPGHEREKGWSGGQQHASWEGESRKGERRKEEEDRQESGGNGHPPPPSSGGNGTLEEPAGNPSPSPSPSTSTSPSHTSTSNRGPWR